MLPALSFRNAAFTRPARRTAVRCLAVLTVAGFSAACGSDDNTNVVTTPSSGVTVSLDKTKVSLVQQGTSQLTATVSGASSSGVTWSSSTPSIVTVSQSGLVTALIPGEASVTATSVADPTKNASAVVVVAFRVNVAQTPGAVDLYVGGTQPGANATQKLTATVTGDANTNVTWVSSNPAVATVDAAGNVTAVSAGSATISSSAVADPTRGGATNITVYPAPTTGTLLQSGVAVTGLGSSVANGGATDAYRIYVAPGTTNLTVTTTGTGDADIYVRKGLPVTAEPTSLTGFTAATGGCNSGGATAAESCSITNPAPGYYYIGLVSYIYSGVTLTAKTTP